MACSRLVARKHNLSERILNWYAGIFNISVFNTLLIGYGLVIYERGGVGKWVKIFLFLEYLTARLLYDVGLL